MIIGDSIRVKRVAASLSATKWWKDSNVVVVTRDGGCEEANEEDYVTVK
jgi:hypothetical protein